MLSKLVLYKNNERLFQISVLQRDFKMETNRKVDNKKVTADSFKLFAHSDLPTRYGVFQMMVFHNTKDNLEHFALVYGKPDTSKPVLSRVHSECLTGEVLGSLRCDCKAQLDLSMKKVAENGTGVVVYLRQEGRGIGLGNKVKAYRLQEQGLDTYDANHQLGFAHDLRKYDIAAAIFTFLDIKKVLLMTNNPDKVTGLEENGITVIKRIPHEIEPNEHSLNYLKAKRDKHRHMITNLSGEKFKETEH